jgi:hypothetical protein
MLGQFLWFTGIVRSQDQTQLPYPINLDRGNRQRQISVLDSYWPRSGCSTTANVVSDQPVTYPPPMGQERSKPRLKYIVKKLHFTSLRK